MTDRSANSRILTINGGSSSIKFAMFESGDTLPRILSGRIERIGLPDATFHVKGQALSEDVSQVLKVPDHNAAASFLIDWITQQCDPGSLIAIGHRVVNGGPDFYKPQPITSDLLNELRRISPLDPAHLPEEILLTEKFHRQFPDVAQVACFDTAFHHDLPPWPQLLPIPRRYFNKGIRRYGFHGLSYAFLMEELSRLAGVEAARGRVVLATWAVAQPGGGSKWQTG